jgi:hypothetical protein
MLIYETMLAQLIPQAESQFSVVPRSILMDSALLQGDFTDTLGSREKRAPNSVRVWLRVS